MSKRSKECVTFGRKVRKFRLLRSLSQESLADKTGIHRTYIGGIERGERNPTLLMIHRIAKSLGIDLPELFTEGE